MKKLVVFVFLITLLTLMFFPSVNAAINATQEKQKIDQAYNCLNNKTNNTCSSFSTEEKIFTLLALNKCQAQVLNASSNTGECWPAGSCTLKTTSQAILALDNSNQNTDKAQAWLLNQTRPTTDLTWFLEVDSASAAQCNVEYAGNTYNFNIGGDKKLSGNAGSCLTLAEGDYWFRIAPSCFNEEFSVSCDKSFLTTLLFRKTGSTTTHVSPQSSSAAGAGTTQEKVESFCFTQNNLCNYEGSLWAAYTLDSQGKDVSSYLPYLLTVAEDNNKFLPDAFLYGITADLQYRTAVLGKQKSKKWWSESGDKYYDTALALYPFQKETLDEKTNSKEWLLSTQDSNGCWENNVRNTAFILNSIWPRAFSGSSTGGTSSGGTSSSDTFECESAGYSCTTSSICADSNGEVLSQYNCPSPSRCCSAQPRKPTCLDQGGVICTSSQNCIGGVELSASDTIGQNCCVGGTCQQRSSETFSECESAGGSCRSFGCNANEEENTDYSCSNVGGVCCVAKSTSSSKGSLTWVWILLVLIVILTILIVFREKLRMMWIRMTKKSPGGFRPGPPTHGPGHPPYSPPPTFFPRTTMPVERRIMPPSPPRTTPPARPAPKPKSAAQKELDDVLKKLKDMAK